jgi:hypothetical protein
MPATSNANPGKPECLFTSSMAAVGASTSSVAAASTKTRTEAEDEAEDPEETVSVNVYVSPPAADTNDATT